MIELPECYVLADQIGQKLVGRTVHNVVANAHPHAFAWYTGDPAEYGDKLSGRKLTSANPGTGHTCGGNTEVVFEDDMLMVFSTPIRYHAPGDKLPAKHQMLIEFDDGSHLSATVQMWGAMLCFPIGGALPEGYTVNKAPTPLEATFDEAHFERLLTATKPGVSVKAFLATEQRIPGLGNGVLQDILFNARLRPQTKLDQLTDSDIENLFSSTRRTIGEMMFAGGRDTERDLFGVFGGYRTILSKKTVDKPCPVCGGAIERKAYLGGNVYFCPVCQR